MANVWTPTPTQQRAIEEASGNILVSAGAGSGKTATMTERIAQYLLHHPDEDPSRLLVVTFTKAAAAELKSRIESRLKDELPKSKNKQTLARQILALERASISTIHSFCLRLLRSNAAALGLAPDFSVADEATINLMKQECITDAVNLCYEKYTESTEQCASFKELATSLGSPRDQAKLDDALLQLLNKVREKGLMPLDLRAFADERDRQAEAGGFSGSDAEACRLSLSEMAHYYQLIFEKLAAVMSQNEVLKTKRVPDAEALADAARKLGALAAGGDYPEIQAFLEAVSFDRLPALKADDKTDESDLFAQERNEFKSALGKMKEQLFAFPTDSLATSAHQIARFERAIANAYETFLQIFTEAKHAKALMDYADLEIETLHLLQNADGTPTPLAIEESFLFDQIFVDEYQDTNHIQDAIFKAIERNHNRFLVGDIKQSIYAFRGAEPSIFSNYRKTWPLGQAKDGYLSLSMSENFRCNRPIIDFSNLVSDTVFPASSLAYTSEDHLIFAKRMPEGLAQEPPVTLRYLAKGDESETEASYVAAEIKHLLTDGRKNDGSPFLPKDIVILLRSPSNSAENFIQALQAAGIPTQKEVKLDFFAQPEIQLALCLLQTVNNPTKDIFLFGFLKSPLAHLSLDDITKIRKRLSGGTLWDALRHYAEVGENPLAETASKILSKINSYREMARGMPSDKLIQFLFTDTGLLDAATASETNPEQVQHHLQSLHELAREYESVSFEGLYGFLNHLEHLSEEANLSFTLPSSLSEGVRIMSVHESKGLEFDAVFLSSTEKTFNMTDSREQVLVDSVSGLALMLPDPSNTIKVNTWQKNVTAMRIAQLNQEEEMRILYVALTRAKERLYITGTLNDPTKSKEEMRILVPFIQKHNEPKGAFPFHLIHRYSSFAKWILMAWAQDPWNRDLLFLESTSAAQTLPEEEKPIPSASLAPETTESSSEALKKLISNRLAYRYPYEYLQNIPAKMIVSRLHPGVLDPQEEELLTSSLDAFPSIHRPEKIIPEPQFMSGMPPHTAAEKGTATHAFLEFCAFDQLLAENGIENEIVRLVNHQFITAEMADLIDRKMIERFTSSALFQRIQRARKVEKEFRFYTSLPAYHLTENDPWKQKLMEQKTTVMIQGVVDCFFEDENGQYVLIDYKTDHLSDDVAKDREKAKELLLTRHRTQLSFYRQACEQMMNQAIHEVYIFSLSLGEAFLVE